MDKDNEGNVHDKEEEPDINMLEIGCLWERGINGCQESRKNKKAGESSHKSISKIRCVDEKGEIRNQPQEEGLEKSC